MENERLRTLLRIAGLLSLLYLFFLGLDLMGLAFKLFGRDLAETLIEQTANPIVGLFIGILATSLVQSSSTTTSITVGLVAADALTIGGAIPIIMGANIGTSVTNTLVSMGHITRREEFQRALAGATVHDFFNWLAVLLLLPLEIATGYLARASQFLEKLLEGVGGIELFNPLRAIVRPTAGWFSHVLGDVGWLVLALGVLLLIASLKLLVDVLKRLMTAQAETILHRTLFRSAAAAALAGIAVTVMVQSSSITTSVVIPLVGAGIVTLEQIFPYTIGANIGTTITAMLAALSTGSPAAVSVAFSHLLFNITGSALIYLPRPMRAVPLAMARSLGKVGSRRRILAGVYILVLFYGIPFALLFLTGTL
jgi:sodium-dependent phosphate cotransporter